MTQNPYDERARRWRLVLGGGEADAFGLRLSGADAGMDQTLDALYGDGRGRGARPAPGRTARPGAGLGASAPQAARWLTDVRRWFPSSVLHLLQRDAIERLGIEHLLAEPELLAAVEPDVHLVGTLLSLSRALPESAREAARQVVRTVTADLERRLAVHTRTALGGALDRAARAVRPRLGDVDWNRTIRANLNRGNWLSEHGAVVPEKLVGYARARRGLRREVVLCVDQSGSMAASVVFASVFASVLASLPALTTRLIAFDTSVVDLTGLIADPVDVLFGVQLGGGTDIGRALAYCAERIARPTETVLVLVSDLHDGASEDQPRGHGGWPARLAALQAAGVRCVALPALCDEGAPAYHRENAAALAAVGIPVFSCSPDRFPEVMAAALEGRPLPQ
ncbi:VWA domain-containing protein [Phaeacidiphilus oryzae]|uniref:VWA domain-containing protein n=1 Tax=Phaeacidiphilus oryzae TaxID=348818 RepID=UPI000569ED25|nr:VWA domain-containing protein [Phaeacidiphilus oryzae]